MLDASALREASSLIHHGMMGDTSGGNSLLLPIAVTSPSETRNVCPEGKKKTITQQRRDNMDRGASLSTVSFQCTDSQNHQQLHKDNL